MPSGWAGSRTVTLIPSCSKSVAPSKPAPSNSQRTPRPGRSHHWVSRALTTNQPCPLGTSPRSVGTSSASFTIPLARQPAVAVPRRLAPLEVRVRLVGVVRLFLDACVVPQRRLVDWVPAPVGVVDGLVPRADRQHDAPAACADDHVVRVRRAMQKVPGFHRTLLP